MPRDPDKYDFFVSYARSDNRDGWITAFVDELLTAHRRFSGGHELTYFLDKNDIHSFDDWQHSLNHGLAASRLFLAFLSPNYFASEWCRREWKAWIDTEIAKHILSAGAAPIYFVEVPGFVGKMPGLTEQAMLGEHEVARKVAELCGLPEPRGGFIEAAAPVIHQLRDRRQIVSEFVQPFVNQGIEALRQDDLREVLDRLAHDLDQRADDVHRAAESETTVPPYNKQFSGRLKELLDLRDRLKDDRAGVISGVHGLGGVGKTELAFTYAHAFAGAYPGGRFLIECEGKSTLPSAVLGTGSFTQFEFIRDHTSEEERMQPKTYFAAIQRCLRKRLDDKGRILLVLDNVTDADLLEPEETDHLTMLGPMLHLLATTRLPAGTSRHIKWTTLGELSESESLDLLEKHRPFQSPHHAPRDAPSVHESTHQPSERNAAQQIVQRLRGFALAIELVGAWLKTHPSATYAGLADGMGLDDLDHMAEDKDAQLRRHNHEKRLAAVLLPTLAELSEAERLTLEYAACLAPDHVPLPWLRELVVEPFPDLAQIGRYGDPWQELCTRLERLAIFSRADGEGDNPRLVRLHRLVGDLIRRELAEEDLSIRQQAIEALVRQRDAALEQTTHWQEARWEIEPLDALANLWAHNQHPQAAWLLNQAGHWWDNLAEWPRAEPLMRRALTIDEQSYGADDTKVAARLNNLAQLLKATNRLEEAEPLMRSALAIDEQSHGSDHPTVANDLNNLAGLLHATNRLEEAERILHRALAIDERSDDPEHPDVAFHLTTLAALLHDTNRLEEAKRLMLRALVIDEQFYGPDHRNVARNLNNLAVLLQSTNRQEEAEPLMDRALAIDEQFYGADHPKIATHLNNLATLLQATDRLEEAERLMRRALAIDEDYYDLEHPSVAIRLSNLAQLLKATNRLEEAEPLMRRVVDIFEKSLEPDHPDVATSLNNLSQLLLAMNRLEEVEPMMTRVVMILEKSYGESHPKVAIALNNLAALFQATNRLEEAEPLMRRVVEIFLKPTAATGHSHQHLRAVLGNYSHILQALGRSDAEVRRMLNDLLGEYGMSHD